MSCLESMILMLNIYLVLIRIFMIIWLRLLIFFLETLDSPEKASKNIDYFNHGNAIYRNSFMLHVVPVIQETTAISLDALITALEQYSKVVYTQGRLDGSNILKQLNEDKITLQKFEELRNLS